MFRLHAEPSHLPRARSPCPDKFAFHAARALIVKILLVARQDDKKALAVCGNKPLNCITIIIMIVIIITLFIIIIIIVFIPKPEQCCLV